MVRLRPAKAAQLAKYYGVQYTSSAAARLLAHLTVSLPCPLHWQAVPLTYASEPLRIVDFACGDGALLTAIYDELTERVRSESGDERLAALHRYLLEDGLWGFDVQSDPIRVATSRLESRNPRAAIAPSHLFTLPLGRFGRRLALGSLDLLRRRPPPSAHPTSKHLDVPDFHVAIMNPPFTRSVGGNLVFGDFPPASRKPSRRNYVVSSERHNCRASVKLGSPQLFSDLPIAT